MNNLKLRAIARSAFTAVAWLSFALLILTPVKTFDGSPSYFFSPDFMSKLISLGVLVFSVYMGSKLKKNG